MATQLPKKSNQISFFPSIKTWRPFVAVEHVPHLVIAHVLETRQQHTSLCRESFLDSFKSKISRVRVKCLFVRHFFPLVVFISSYLIYRHSTRKTLACQEKNRNFFKSLCGKGLRLRGRAPLAVSRLAVRVYCGGIHIST